MYIVQLRRQVYDREAMIMTNDYSTGFWEAFFIYILQVCNRQDLLRSQRQPMEPTEADILHEILKHRELTLL